MAQSKQRMKCRLFAICVLIGFVLVFSSAAHARIYQNIVAFGDSLSDHHGLEAYLGLYDPVTNPTGSLEVWSNGDVWVEYLAAEWGAELDNNAISGAKSLGHVNENVQALSDSGTLPQLGLVGQVDLFVASPPELDYGETLFTIWIGGNDLLEFGSGESYTADPEVLIGDIMTRISDSVVSLYAEGAVDFLIINLPDLGKTPAYNTRSVEEIAAVTAMAQLYNDALITTIESLETSLEAISIDLFDSFSYLTEIINTGAFVDVTGSYMELDAEGEKTGNVNGDADDYLFWDGNHPMTRVHEMIADEVSETFYAEENDDDDSSCFINSIQGNSRGSADPLKILVMALIFAGIAGIHLRQKG